MITKHFSQNSGLFACAMAVLLVAASPLRADEKTWTGAADGSWANGGNWSPSPLVTDFDSVLYDSSSTANLNQTLDQNWSITGLRVTSAPGPITILPGAGNFVLTNSAGIDLSAAEADLTILADYYPLNNGSLNVAAGRTLTLSNILANINTGAGATIGSGTVRIIGAAKRLTDNLNAITLWVDGGSISANTPVQLGADAGSTVTVIVTNNGSVNITSGNNMRIRLGHIGNANSTNHFILNGGTVFVTGSGNSTANGIIVGDATGTTGILDINNGTIDLTDGSSGNANSLLRLANSAGSVGIVNLNSGGVLRTPRIEAGTTGTAIFNFNGGRVEASTLATFFANFNEVNLLAGGGTIDTVTANRIVTIATSLSGPGGLTKVGPGPLILSATNNTYAGPTVVSNGIFAMTLPMSSSSLTLSSNVAFNVTVGAQANASWSPSAITLQGSNTLTFTYGAGSQPSSTLLNTTTLTVTGTNLINIGGAGWPVGTVRLLDYSGSINGGGTFVLGATLPVGLNAKLTNNLSTTSIDLVVSSGVNNLDWYGLNAFGGTSGGLWDIATSFNWNGGADVYNEYGTGTNQLGDSVRFTPAGYFLVEIATTVRPSSVLITNISTTAYSFVGAGKISGPTSLIKEGNNANSTLNISTLNDYTGGTFIRIGNIVLTADNALPTAGLVYVGSPGNGASFTMNGFNQTIGGLISAGSGAGNRRVLNGSFTPSTLTINVIASQTNIYAHTIGNNSLPASDVANNFSVVKTGPGIQTFSGANYGGTTTISAGTLLFNGNASNLIGDVIAQAGGSVGGNGTGVNAVGAPVIVQSGARLEPGNLGIGTFTVSNSVALQGEAVMQINRTNAQQTADRLVANAINFGGTLTVTNFGDVLQAGDTFNLFSGAFNGNFSSVVLPPLTAGLAWSTNNLTVSGSINVVTLPRPSFVSTTLSGNNLVLSGTGGPTNGTYYVLTSTNVATPRANWTALATNTFNGSGDFSYTNAINPAVPQQFFLLQVP